MSAPLPTYDRRFRARLRARDERAFERLVRDFERRIYSFCYRMLGCPEEAHDVAQDVFFAVFNALPRFRGESKLSTWIYRIATNHCRNRIAYLKRRHARRRKSLSEVHDGVLLSARAHGRAATPLAHAEGRELESHLRRWIRELDENQREFLVLRDIEGLTYEEIVAVTGSPLGTVKSRIHRARLELKRRLDVYQAAVSDEGVEPIQLTVAKV